MASSLIESPFKFFPDVDGTAVDEGYIYIGTDGADPEVTPQAVYTDEALTVAISQPIRTLKGAPVNGSTPVNLYVAGAYSIRVRNKSLTQVFSRPSVPANPINALSASTGSGLIGWIETGPGATATTIAAELRRGPINAWNYGVVADGVTDDTSAIQTVIARGVTENRRVRFRGVSLFSSTITIPDNADIEFMGSPGNFSGNLPTSYFLKKSTMTTTGVVVEGQAVKLQGGGVVAQEGATGLNIQILGNDVVWSEFYDGNSGGDGTRIGEDGTDAPNTNGTRLYGCIDGATGRGLVVNDGTTPGDFTNANVGKFYLKVRGCGSHGIYCGNTFAPVFDGCIVETNTGKGIYIDRSAVSVVVRDGDYELNSAGSTAKGSDIYVAPTEFDCTFTDAGDLVTTAAHGLVNGMPIHFSEINTTTGITEYTTYRVISATTNTFQVSLTVGGAAIALTTNGTGVWHELHSGETRGCHSIHPASCGTPIEYTDTYNVSIQGPNFFGNGADSGSYPVYSEGEFTPVLAGSTAAGTNTYTTQNGFWAKTGRKVDVWVDIQLASSAGMTGNLTIPNLPWRCKSGFSATVEIGIINYVATNASRTVICATVSGKVATFQCYGPTNVTQAFPIDAGAQGGSFLTGGRIAVKFSYITTD